MGEEEFTYKHYLLADNVPVRVLYAVSDGLKAGAQIPDIETEQLVYAHTYLSRIETSSDVEEIDEDTFNRRCEEIFLKKRD